MICGFSSLWWVMVERLNPHPSKAEGCATRKFNGVRSVVWKGGPPAGCRVKERVVSGRSYLGPVPQPTQHPSKAAIGGPNKIPIPGADPTIPPRIQQM
jgi:hypothetical protein